MHTHSHTLTHTHLTAKPLQYFVARHMTAWWNIAFYLAIVINLVVALLYPYEHGNQVLGESFWLYKKAKNVLRKMKRDLAMDSMHSYVLELLAPQCHAFSSIHVCAHMHM